MIIPPYLGPGDTIAIIGMAGKVRKEDIGIASEKFRSWGLKVEVGKHIYDQQNKYAGTDEARQEDFQLALNNPNVKAIIAARGGYGSNKIIENIEWDSFHENPKWIIGLSDITIVLGEVYRQGVASIHGPMPSFFGWDGIQSSLLKLNKLLFGNPPIIENPPSELNIPGKTEGILIGGNLSILASMIGTRSDFEYKDKILVLEEISEPQYKVDRMLSQLDRSGKIRELKGLVCGHFTNCDDDVEFGKSAYEIVKEYTTKYNIPTAFNFPIGHEPESFPVIIGGEYRLEINDEISTLAFIR